MPDLEKIAPLFLPFFNPFFIQDFFFSQPKEVESANEILAALYSVKHSPGAHSVEEHSVALLPAA